MNSTSIVAINSAYTLAPPEVLLEVSTHGAADRSGEWNVSPPSMITCRDSSEDVNCSPSHHSSETWTCENEGEKCNVDEDELERFLQDTFGRMDANQFDDLRDLSM